RNRYFPTVSDSCQRQGKPVLSGGSFLPPQSPRPGGARPVHRVPLARAGPTGRCGDSWPARAAALDRRVLPSIRAATVSGVSAQPADLLLHHPEAVARGAVRNQPVTLLSRARSLLFGPQPLVRLELVRILAPLAILGFLSGRLSHADFWLTPVGFQPPD